jgi:hypothetical protein
MSPVDVKPAHVLLRYKKATGAVVITAAATLLFVLTGIDINEEAATPIVGGVIALVVAVLKNRP